jgi:hypothetical protein
MGKTVLLLEARTYEDGRLLRADVRHVQSGLCRSPSGRREG